MDDRTRDSGSFSNLSDSGRRGAARLGQRRRSTVEVGQSDLVSVPRSTAKHGRRRRSRYGRDVELGVAVSFLRTRCRRTPVVRCRWRRRVGSAPRQPPNNGTQHTVRGFSRTSLSSSERLDCSKSVVELRGTVDANLPARNSGPYAHVFAGKTTPHTEH